MAINLLNLVKDQLTDNLVGKLGGVIGQSSSATSSALGSIIPTILGSIVSKGSTKSGADSLLGMIKDGKHDGSIFDKLPALLGDQAGTSSLMNVGKFLLPLLMGSNHNSILRKITDLTGLTSSNSSSLMNLAAPMVMGMLGKHVMGNNLGGAKLMNLLKGQRSHLDSAMPAGMGSLLGFANTSSGGTSTTTSHETSNQSSGGGGGFLKWILMGVAALALLGYFGLRTGCGAVDDAAQTVSNTTTDVVSSAAETAKGIAGATVDAAGNLVDESGEVISKAGEFTKDAAGNIMDKAGNTIKSAGETASTAAGNVADAANNTVDAAGNAVSSTAGAASNVASNAIDATSNEVTFTMNDAGDLLDAGGKVVYKAGDFTVSDEGYYVDKQGNRIGRALKKIGEAVGKAANATGKAIGTAADKTGEFFNKTFTKMFKKEAGIESTFTLSDIKFNPESHRITSFSKAEVEGLAAALKSNPDAKIQVQGYTNDGKNGAANKTLSNTRAKVVHDMLVTLGVAAKQISHKGFGDKDEAKANADKIEIIVE